jgi:lipopolysaccharide transport system permease protein
MRQTMEQPLPVIRIRPAPGWVPLNLRDLWSYRELLLFLIWRDIKVRYKQAVLGITWAVLQPLLTVVIFSVIFGRLAGLPSEGIPYPIFSLVGLLPWQLFSSGLQRSSASLVSSASLLTKVYFPRLIIPMSAVALGLVDFAISFVIALGLMAYYHTPLTWTALWVLPLTLFTLLTAFSVGLWLSALNVQYRDVQQVVPFLLQAWMYASPVVYSAQMIPSGKWEIINGLNPMAGVIQGFRWALLGTPPPGILMVMSVLVVAFLLMSGLYYFRRMEKNFADVI